MSFLRYRTHKIFRKPYLLSLSLRSLRFSHIWDVFVDAQLCQFETLSLTSFSSSPISVSTVRAHLPLRQGDNTPLAFYTWGVQTN